MGATGVACPACSTELRTDAKFCDECGAPVSRASAAEYKQVTVLFADVVHSMDIAAALGPERLREIMSDLFDRCCDVVQRYGGTVNQFTGDGIMAVFGAPISLEDHAVRACLAAVDIQQRARDLAVEVAPRDGIDLRLRVGLNSGEVIAGEVGSRTPGYTTIGDQVGMAQRMESAAPPGGVMLSESTARLVENEAMLGERRLVEIKGADTPVPARELLSVSGRSNEMRSWTAAFVGRAWELSALTAMLDRAADGHGSVVSVVGPAGIGKSRLVAETAKLAANRGLQVYSTYCESHTSDVPFQVAIRLLRSAWRLDGLDDEAARDAVRTRVPGADAADLVLMHDELGIRDPSDSLPEIAPEARRRRLTALVNASVVAREEPVVFVIEDVHWIDPTSESLLADFLSVIPRASVLVLITYRPDYGGALSRSPSTQTIALAPLDDSHMSGLITELLGQHPSVAELADRVAERASGNPFFAEEIVRDLADRGVLCGERGDCTCEDVSTDVEVPATLQAAIAARIDRLAPDAKQTLSAAAVIGLRFDEELLPAVSDGGDLEPLIGAELIDQVAFTPQAQYAFRHPLIRTVAYQSQLKSDRARLHRRLAAALESRDPASADENAALIAEHHEAAGDLPNAFGWHMRAGMWLTFRDIHAARLSWQRARQVADRLPADDPGRNAMRIAPRGLLCASGFRAGAAITETGFEELCDLASGADDKVALVLAMDGQALMLGFRGRYREASELASELTSLIDVIGDPMVAITHLPTAILAKLADGEFAECLRLAERVIDLTDGDPHKGRLIIESPLSNALLFRAVARMCLGARGWRDDIEQATAMCRDFAPLGEAAALFWRYGFPVLAGAIRADAAAVSETAEVLERAERQADDMALECGRFLHGLVLAQQDEPDRGRGLRILAAARESAVLQRSVAVYTTVVDIQLAKEAARVGDVDHAVEVLDTIIGEENADGAIGVLGLATDTLVESLLKRATNADVRSAQAAIERLAAAITESGVVLYDILLLRLRALVARALGDEPGYQRYVDQYRLMANEIGFEGHMVMAEAMT
jgi:adenylate cyclase